ncbi:MAG TPA: YhjD/YihY/BrkB family envelope integrity protein [Solirubrobacteraceae bacterium]|nr:YhjD/YihY/BrkB family envelope integrity protein [Solirubrobacteraceae bacterium]
MGRLGRRVFDFYWGQGIADDVPALAYYLLLSLAPFALGAAALEALLLKDFLSALEVADQLNRFLPDAVHADVERLVIGTRDNSPWLLAVAIATMLWTSSGAIGVIERCESRILDCPRHDVVVGRLRNLALGALVAVAFVFATAGAPVIGDALRRLSLGGSVVWLMANAVGSVLVFAVIYRYAPRARMRWGAALRGALPAGIALPAIPWLIGLYFDAAAGFAAVRLFLLLAVLLLGLYTMAMVMLLGAGVAVQAERRLRDRAQERAATRRGPVSTAPAPSSSGTGDAARTAYSGAGPSTS